MIKRKERGHLFTLAQGHVHICCQFLYMYTYVYAWMYSVYIYMYAYSIIIHCQLKLISTDSQGGSFWSVCWKFKTYLLKRQPGNLTRRATTLLMWVLPLFLFHKWANNSQINVKVNECPFRILPELSWNSSRESNNSACGLHSV